MKKSAYGGRICRECIQMKYCGLLSKPTIAQEDLENLLCSRSCKMNRTFIGRFIKASHTFLNIHSPSIATNTKQNVFF